MTAYLRSPVRCTFNDVDDSPGLVLGKWPALRDRNAIPGLALIRSVVREHLRRPADIFAVDGMLDEAFDRDGDGLVHLVAHNASDNRPLHLFRVFTHFSSPAERVSSFSTVFTRAMSLRTRRCSWLCISSPVACCIRRLNCSRRNWTSSSLSSSADLFLRSLTCITSPAGLRIRS